MTNTFETSIEIAATPQHVFGYFTNPETLTQWIGDYAVLDAQPGGEFTLDIQGIPVRGEYLRVEEFTKIVVSWGHAGSSTIPVGSTEVEFGFDKVPKGTRVSVTHRGLAPEHLESHQQGWPMFLGQLVEAVTA